MTRSSFQRLSRIHGKYHTDPEKACRICEIIWRWLESQHD